MNGLKGKIAVVTGASKGIGADRGSFGGGSGRTHRINVRVVAATHRNLAEMVKRNEFRSNLYYRLNVFPVLLPPLRERQRDISQLVSHFVEVLAARWVSKLPVSRMKR